MAIDMIELECPSCRELLELDPGFAGGVCRCSSCSTLMTVPSNPRRDRAEALSRPDRPDAPAGGASASGTRIRRPETPGDEPLVQPEVGSAQTFVTQTGRVVTIDARTHIPTAGKRQRKGVRMATIAIFCGVIGIVLVACIAAIVVMIQSTPARQSSGPDLDDPTTRALLMFTYDRDANPMLIEQPNVLGLPISQKTGVVFDTLGVDSQMKQAAATLIARGLAHPQVKAEVVLIATDAIKPLDVKGGLASLSSYDQAKVAKALSEVAPKQNELADAVRKAMVGEPTQLILVTAQNPGPTELAAIEAVLAARPQMPVDVVMLNADSPALEDLAQQRNGRFVRLSQMRAIGWLEDAATASTP